VALGFPFPLTATLWCAISASPLTLRPSHFQAHLTPHAIFPSARITNLSQASKATRPSQTLGRRGWRRRSTAASRRTSAWRPSPPSGRAACRGRSASPPSSRRSNVRDLRTTLTATSTRLLLSWWPRNPPSQLHALLILSADPTVRFLRERMEKAGCRVWPRFVNAGICKTAGGYASGHGVRILFFPSVFILLRRLSLGSVPEG
jgi:hypothetical protein